MCVCGTHVVHDVQVVVFGDAAAAQRAGHERRQRAVVVAAQRDGVQPRVVALQLQLADTRHAIRYVHKRNR